MNWRKWNNIIHRDLGYLCFGLTVIYAISGVAVNHIHQWNPSYSIENSTSVVKLGDPARPVNEQALVILSELGIEQPVKNIFQPSREILQIFLEGNTITVNLANGNVTQQKAVARPVLKPLNFLHLNHPKKLWTYFADIYAIALLILAVTGLFILKGRNGITGRGAWLTGFGIILPLFFIWLYL